MTRLHRLHKFNCFKGIESLAIKNLPQSSWPRHSYYFFYGRILSCVLIMPNLFTYISPVFLLLEIYSHFTGFITLSRCEQNVFHQLNRRYKRYRVGWWRKYSKKKFPLKTFSCYPKIYSINLWTNNSTRNDTICLAIKPW